MPKTNVVNTFLEIVQIDSPTFHEEKMTKYVHDYLRKIGLSPKIDKEGNVIVFLKGDPKKEVYLINAHLDTVQDPEKGSVIPHIDKNGYVVSNGKTILGADNKTAVAAILDTINKLVSEKNNSHHPLEVVFTVSEESGNHGAHGLNYKELKSKRGYCFDAGGRKFGDMIISSPFYNRFDLTIFGKSAHASRPELANNVLPIFSKSFLKLKLGRISKQTTANIGIVSVGKVGGPVNTIPGEIVIGGEVRSMKESELEKVTLKIKKTFENEAKKADAKIEFKKVRENDGFSFSIKDQFIKNTLKQLNSLGVKKPDLVKSWGCYEANIFAAHGIMMLNIADGSLDNHTEKERIKVLDLEKLQNLVYELVIS
jgi:tripeptide aminopeptidase